MNVLNNSKLTKIESTMRHVKQVERVSSKKHRELCLLINSKQESHELYTNEQLALGSAVIKQIKLGYN